jgi:YbbR domain-containing protein
MGENAPLPPDAQTTPTGRQRLKGQISGGLVENLWLKLLALGLAALLWFIITNREPTARSVSVQLKLTLDSSLVLQVPPEDINAIVQGAPADLLKLGSRRATITRQINAQAPDTLVIDISPGDVELPASVAGLLSVTDVFPKSVTLQFVRTLSRRVAVRSSVRVMGVLPNVQPTIAVDPATVEISGPRRAVAQVAFVRTDSAVIAIGDSLPHQVPIDTTGLGITVKPEQVRVRVIQRRIPR